MEPQRIGTMLCTQAVECTHDCGAEAVAYDNGDGTYRSVCTEGHIQDFGAWMLDVITLDIS